MDNHYRVGGYVKLAKLWDRSREAALAFHKEYYRKKFSESEDMRLIDVYIDITGNKEIRRRPEMLRLIRDCKKGNVNCIATQTRAYLAANNEEFFYLIHLLFELNPPVEIITEDDDYIFNTIWNPDHQREVMKQTASEYVQMNPEGYRVWENAILRAIGEKQEQNNT